MANNVNPDSFNKIYTTAYVHGQNEDIASAYLGAIDNTPRYDDATFDYRKYLTLSMNNSSTLDKSLFSLEFLYKTKIDSILNNTFKLNFLYDSNRLIKDIYANIESVRANNSIGIFDLSTCFYTTNYTKKLPLTSTFENTKFKEFLENNPKYFDNGNLTIDKLIDTEKFKDKSARTKLDTEEELNGCIKVFQYTAPKRNTVNGSIISLRRQDNTNASFYYDGNNIKEIKVYLKDTKSVMSNNNQFYQVDYNKNTDEYVALIRVDFDDPELFYSKDLLNWTRFSEENTSDYYILDDKDRISITDLWDYTSVSRLNINILNMWNFDNLTIIAYNEKNSSKLSSFDSKKLSYMYSTDNKTWNKCTFDDELLDLLSYSKYSKYIKIEKIDDKYYLYSIFGIINGKYLENSNNNDEKYGLFISDDGINWKAFKDCKPNSQIYNVTKIDESVYISTRITRNELKDCDAPEEENHQPFYYVYDSYDLYRLTSDSVHTIYDSFTQAIDKIFKFDDKIILVYFNFISRRYSFNQYSTEDNGVSLILSDIRAYTYLNKNKVLFYSVEPKDIRYAFSIEEITSDTAKTSTITDIKHQENYKITDFIVLKDEENAYNIGVVLENTDKIDNFDVRYSIAWSHDLKETITTTETITEENKNNSVEDNQEEINTNETTTEVDNQEETETPVTRPEFNFTIYCYSSDKWGPYSSYRLIDDVSDSDKKILLLFRADSNNRNSVNICYANSNRKQESYHNYDLGINNSYLYVEMNNSNYIKYRRIDEDYYIVTDNYFIKLDDNFYNVKISKSSNSGFIITKDNLLYVNNYEYELYPNIVPTKKIDYFFIINDIVFTMGKINKSFVYVGNLNGHFIKETDHISKDYHLISNCKVVSDQETFEQKVLFNVNYTNNNTKYYDSYCDPQDFYDFIGYPTDQNYNIEDDYPITCLTNVPPYDNTTYFTITNFNTYNSFIYASSINIADKSEPDYVSFDGINWFTIERNEADELGDLYKFNNKLIGINVDQITVYDLNDANKTGKMNKEVLYLNKGTLLKSTRNDELSTYSVKDVIIDTNQTISLLLHNDNKSAIILTMKDLFTPISTLEAISEDKSKLILLDDKRFISLNSNDIITSYSQELYDQWISGIKEYFEYYKINYALDIYYNKLIDDFESDFKEITSEYLTFYDFITKFGVTSDKHSASKIVKLYNHIIKMQEFIAFVISIHETIETSFKLYSKYFENKDFDYTRLCKKDFVVVPHIYNVIWSIIDTRLSKLSNIKENTEVFNYFSNILIKENSTFDSNNNFVKKYQLIDPIRESAINGNQDDTNNNMDKVYSVLTQNYCRTMNILNNYDPFDDEQLTTTEEKYNKKFIKYLYMATMTLQIFDVISSTSSVNKSLDTLSFDTIMQVLRIDYKKNYSDEEVFNNIITNLK